MRTLAALWDFIAGDSRRTPVALAAGVASVLGLERAHASGLALALGYAGIIAAGLVWASFEGP